MTHVQLGTLSRRSIYQLLLGFGLLVTANAASGAASVVRVESPNARNSIALSIRDYGVYFAVTRDSRVLFGPSRCGPVLAEVELFDKKVRIVEQQSGDIDETFPLYWGKTSNVANRCSYAVVTLENSRQIRWQVELRAYDDGVAFRYRLMRQDGLVTFTVKSEATQFEPVGEPVALFNMLESFTTSHESLYERRKLTAIPAGKLMDCPLLLVWPDGPAAAITEARVRDYAGMYLERASMESTALCCRLSPLPSRKDISVVGKTPRESPWRVVLLADVAGELLESNLLLCLNEVPKGDFTWALPGKSTFHWWYGEFEDDHERKDEREIYAARHRKYIDFCAENNIAYHAVSGDGLAWYKQSPIGYGTPAEDADVRIARPELGLPEILAYAKTRGVGIRLWVHWKALSMHLEEAMKTYESWGVKGLMVDFLDRDDQEMIEFSERMLESAARHRIHIQVHGSSKYSGEQRTFPNLFNREGVLNLEYVKWSNLCTPAHSVNVAFTRALAGPVDFHLGGLRCVTRAEFQPRDRAPVVMGTRCHHLALYVVYENPMPMVADAPTEYSDRKGFEFIKEVPTTWDETRFLMGEAGEYIVIARRKDDAWYVGGITNWTSRDVRVPMVFLGDGKYEARSWFDGPEAESQPNQLRTQRQVLERASRLNVKMASGGGFVSVIQQAASDEE